MNIKFNPNISIYDNWNTADPLSSAWFQFAPNDLKEQYRGSGRSEAKTATVRRIMEMDVYRLVGDKQLLAFGVKTKPTLEIEPELIPAMMFASATVQIDSEKCEINGLGAKYEDVRICENIADSRLAEIKSSAKASKRGPKPLDDILFEAFASVEREDGHFADRSQEKQILAIQLRVTELHPGRFPNGSKPGHTTVWRYLKKLNHR